MEFSWRTIMILIGLMVVVVILVDGFRRMRQARTAALRLDVTTGSHDDMDDINPELPSGGFRVVSSQTKNTASDLPESGSVPSETDLKGFFSDDVNNGTAGTGQVERHPPKFNIEPSPSFTEQGDNAGSALTSSTESSDSDETVSYSSERIEPSLSGFDQELVNKADQSNDQASVEVENEESLNGVAGIEALVSSVTKQGTQLQHTTADERDQDQPVSNAELQKYADIVNSASVDADVESGPVAETSAASELKQKSQPTKSGQPEASMFERLMGNAGVQINTEQDIATIDSLEAFAETTIIDNLQQSAPEERAADASELVAAADKYVSDIESQPTTTEEVAHATTMPDVENVLSIEDPELDNEVDGLPPEPIKLPVNYAGPNAEVLADRPEPELVLVINTIAADPDGFDGEALLFLLNSCDLRFGEKKIFHRFEQADGGGCVQFSVAQSHEPGVFDAETMSAKRFTGLTFFLSLPGAKKPLEAYEAMYELAMAVSRNLKADVLDGSYSAMTTQTREHDRQLILDFERKQQLLAKKAQRMQG